MKKKIIFCVVFFVIYMAAIVISKAADDASGGGGTQVKSGAAGSKTLDDATTDRIRQILGMPTTREEMKAKTPYHQTVTPEQSTLQGDAAKGSPDPDGIRGVHVRGTPRLSPGDVNPSEAAEDPADTLRRMENYPPPTSTTEPPVTPPTTPAEPPITSSVLPGDWEHAVEPNHAVMGVLDGAAHGGNIYVVDPKDREKHEAYKEKYGTESSPYAETFTNMGVIDFYNPADFQNVNPAIVNILQNRVRRSDPSNWVSAATDPMMTLAELNRITNDPSYGIGYKTDACLKYQNQRIARNWYRGYRSPSGIRPPGQIYRSSIFVTRIPSMVDYRASQLKYQQKQQSSRQSMQMMGALAGAVAAQMSQGSSGYGSAEGQHVSGTCGRK